MTPLLTTLNYPFTASRNKNKRYILSCLQLKNTLEIKDDLLIMIIVEELTKVAMRAKRIAEDCCEGKLSDEASHVKILKLKNHLKVVSETLNYYANTEGWTEFDLPGDPRGSSLVFRWCDTKQIFLDEESGYREEIENLLTICF